MLLRILRTTAADGRIVREGDEVEVSKHDARILVSGRKAIVIDAPSPPTVDEQDNPAPRRGRPRKNP